MKITLKQNEKPELPMCHFTVDGHLDPKLESYELTKFLNMHSVNAFIGKPKSGKTSLLYQLFKSKKVLRKVFHKIYLFMPPQSRASMKDSIFDVLPDSQKFGELTFENLQSVLDEIKTDDEANYCIIFDDCGAYLKDHEITQLLKQIVMNRRHLHISIFFLVQTWLSIPQELRRLISNLFIFKPSKQTFEQIFEECVESITNKREILQIFNQVYTEPHTFLFINTESGRMFKNWDELIIDTV